MVLAGFIRFRGSFRRRERMSVQIRLEAVKDGQQAGAAGIHDARLLKNRQQLRRAVQRGFRLFAQQVEIFVDGALRMILDIDIRIFRAFPDNRQDRPFHRPHHSLVRDLGAVEERFAELGDRQLLLLADALVETAEDLRQDDAGVSARAHQQSSGKRLGNDRQILTAGLGDFGDAVAERHRHIGAGVSVRYREHI